MNTQRSLPLESNLLEEKIGYSFIDKELLTEALTHSSYVNEHKASINRNCNERLEFLGDSVLSVIVSKYIFNEYKSRQEGDLTKIRAAVVCEKALAKYAKEIGLGEYLYLGNGEDKNNGRSRASITSDAFEALLGAFFIDCGYNAEKVGEFLLPFITREIDYIRTGESFVDYKTALQQIIQQASGEVLKYVVTGESGPDHDKVFCVEALLNSNVIGRGEGSSKRAAEQNAAREALKLFGESEVV